MVLKVTDNFDLSQVSNVNIAVDIRGSSEHHSQQWTPTREELSGAGHYVIQSWTNKASFRGFEFAHGRTKRKKFAEFAETFTITVSAGKPVNQSEAAPGFEYTFEYQPQIKGRYNKKASKVRLGIPKPIDSTRSGFTLDEQFADDQVLCTARKHELQSAGLRSSSASQPRLRNLRPRVQICYCGQDGTSQRKKAGKGKQKQVKTKNSQEKSSKDSESIVNECGRCGGFKKPPSGKKLSRRETGYYQYVSANATTGEDVIACKAAEIQVDLVNEGEECPSTHEEELDDEGLFVHDSESYDDDRVDGIHPVAETLNPSGWTESNTPPTHLLGVNSDFPIEISQIMQQDADVQASELLGHSNTVQDATALTMDSTSSPAPSATNGHIYENSGNASALDLETLKRAAGASDDQPPAKYPRTAEVIDLTQHDDDATPSPAADQRLVSHSHSAEIIDLTQDDDDVAESSTADQHQVNCPQSVKVIDLTQDDGDDDANRSMTFPNPETKHEVKPEVKPEIKQEDEEDVKAEIHTIELQLEELRLRQKQVMLKQKLRAIQGNQAGVKAEAPVKAESAAEA